MTASVPIILDARGAPLRAQTNFDAAERAGRELASWQPGLRSADGEWLPERDTAIARTHDMIRNNGLISGAVQTQVDNLVGAGLRLAAKPNWRVLGITDAKAQLDIESAIEAAFEVWACDPGKYCDAARSLNFGGLIARGARTYLSTFEILASMEWLPRPGASYATAVQGIDPLRLSQPRGEPETSQLKAGVALDRFGAPTGYWISNRVPSDPYQVTPRNELLEWTFYPRETSWGRARIIHVYEHEKAGQTRGRGGILSVISRGKMLDKHSQAHLQAAILGAVYSMFVTSPMTWQEIGAAIGAGQDLDQVSKYLTAQTDFHKEANVRFNGVKIPHLFPGEKIEHPEQSHPSASFEAFERVFHRYMAAGLGMTYEQFSKDYSQTNYSGHRAALLDYWRFITGRRNSIVGNFGGAIYVCWLEEFMDSGALDALLPAGVPAFWEAKAAWSAHEWIGPGKGQIDPLKEANATMVEYRCGMTTLEAECAERGRDWRAVMIQRAQEAQEATRLESEYGLAPGTLNFAQGNSPAAPGPEGNPTDAPREQKPASQPEPSYA